MKRWQDRGEVLDSDDEDSLVRAHSQDLQGRRKRLKSQDTDNETVDDRSQDVRECQHEESDSSLRAVAVTYGRKARSSPRHEPHLERLASKTFDNATSGPMADGVYASSLRTSPFMHGSSALDHEALPENHQGVVVRGQVHDEVSPWGDSGSELSSAPLSPMSGLSIGVNLVPKASYQNIESSWRSATERSPNFLGASIVSEHQTQRTKADAHDILQTGQRTLRTRTENQLHPYMLERLQYQRQFRERGLRPIRLEETNDDAAETQEASSHENDSQSSQASIDVNSPKAASSDAEEETSQYSPGSRSPKLLRVNAASSDEELPELGPFHKQGSRFEDKQTKRRKLVHATKIRAIRTPGVDAVVPLSPASAAGNAVGRAPTTSVPARFKWPQGLVQAPLPTPQRSSSPALMMVDDASDAPSEELSRPAPRSLSRKLRSTSKVEVIESSSESSAAEDVETQTYEQRLVFQSRRIKGVLPASWLKIDLEAQQRRANRPSARHQRERSFSPTTSLPQRGIAQRVVSRRSRSPSELDGVVIPDVHEDEDEPAQDTLSPERTAAHQPKLSRQSTVAPSEFVDVDGMELDWVDPMLVGNSRSRNGPEPCRARQRKVTETFRRVQIGSKTRSKSSSNMARVHGQVGHKIKPGQRDITAHGSGIPPASRLSIVDAPRNEMSAGGSLPQFLRLAMRRARRQTSQGRHSPSRKIIRLATSDETAEATSVLRAWRCGTLVPQSVPSSGSRHQPIDPAVHHEYELAERQSRAPLSDLQPNSQHRRLPVLDKGGKERECHRSAPPSRRSRLVQTRIHSALLSAKIASKHAQASSSPSILGSERVKPRSKRRRHVQSDVRYRDAQLESLEGEFDTRYRALAFERRIHGITQSIPRNASKREHCVPQLERFLYEGEGKSVSIAREGSIAIEGNAGFVGTAKLHQRGLAPRPRKHAPRRLDVDAYEFRQPCEPLPDAIELCCNQEQTATTSDHVLGGLGSFGTTHATHFDVRPLALGTYFHASSFIGSGDFAASLNLAARDLDQPTGRIRIHLDSEILDCGAWTEEVATGLAKIPSAVARALGSLDEHCHASHIQENATNVVSNVDYLLRSTVRYFARCVAFLDSVDRQHCVSFLHSLIDDLLETVVKHFAAWTSSANALTRCLQYALVLSRQAWYLSLHQLVEPRLKVEGQRLLGTIAQRLAGATLSGGMPALRKLYEDNRHVSKRGSGLLDSDITMCSIVMLRHALQGGAITHVSFWNIINVALGSDLTSMTTVPALDRVWYDVFTIQPTLELDAHGIFRPGDRLEDAHEDWTAVKSLVDRVFELYPSTTTQLGSTINDYLRAILTRCHFLITRWGWWRCESILGSIYDFFARRNLEPLHLEEQRGSPRFLEQLDQHPAIHIQDEDRSFSIFLKILVCALQGMAEHHVYPHKKVGAIAWRFIPNHGRMYRKDTDVRQTDIDALRNHHDLLCSLYYASPPGHRLRVQLIQDLVDHSSSHREACRLSVRAWGNLASYQASACETADGLDDFTTWWRDLVATTIDQYRLARVEVEQDVAVAKAQSKFTISRDVAEDTIARNQQQIAATIVDALAALKRALQSASSSEVALSLLDGTSFWQIFALPDLSGRRLHTTIDEVLEVICTAVEVQHKFLNSTESQPLDDDSQDYGDSSALQELTSVTSVKPLVQQRISQVLQSAAQHLLSNLFGADSPADDVVLTKLIDVWVQLADGLVKDGNRRWEDFIHGYGPNAWTQLRDTIQRRRYTAYFLSRIVHSTQDSTIDPTITSLWLRSLVEREATLKFQHMLTSALLNCYSADPLLDNLPFSRCATGRYDVSLHDLRHRRLALLSTVLNNMRQDFDVTLYERPDTLQALRVKYSDMLRQVMQAMKDHYRELQVSSEREVAETQASGSYVEFVQHIVSFLQQYTTDICPVDRFFTDSAVFPLPATDPMYVVGRLKGYVPKLAESRKRKELAVFIHTISERAAVDNQQDFLADQLATAMMGVLERGNALTPSLRLVFCTAILPAYVGSCWSTACSWITAVPMIGAVARTIASLLYDVKLEDAQSLQAGAATIAAFLQSLVQPIQVVLYDSAMLAQAHVCRLLGIVFDAARSCLTCVRHWQHFTTHCEDVAAMLSDFSRYAGVLEDAQSESTRPSDSERPKQYPLGTSDWADTLEFTRKQVQDRLNNDWDHSDGRYFVKRGNTSIEIEVDLRSMTEEREALVASLKRFRQSYVAIFCRNGRVFQEHRTKSDLSALIV